MTTPRLHAMDTGTAMPEMISLVGCSGRSYPFTVLPLGSRFAAMRALYAVLTDGPGVRCWTRPSLLGIGHQTYPSHARWTVLYIGQTADLATRFANADRDPDLARIRASHLAIARVEAEPVRRAIEGDLVPRYASLLARPRPPQRRQLVESITIAQRQACPQLP